MSEKLDIAALFILGGFAMAIALSILALMILSFGAWGVLVFIGISAVAWAVTRIMPRHGAFKYAPPLPTHKHKG